MNAINEAAANLARISELIDNANQHRDPEALTWGRLSKITEEAGEVIQAFIGATGQNPRKGFSHDMNDVTEELLDVAVTALTALEHLTNNQGIALGLLVVKANQVKARLDG